MKARDKKRSAIESNCVSETCPKCDGPTPENLRTCPSCDTDIGFPNVRRAARESERKALLERFKRAARSAEKRGCVPQFDSLRAVVSNESHVVISMSPLVARQLLQDRRKLYENYEELTVQNKRIPAAVDDDRLRWCVGSAMFGGYASNIRYGILSLDGRGLPTYGKVYLQLRDVTVRDRVSFLEMNSYQFVQRNTTDPGAQLPSGYLSTWDSRHDAAATKLEPRLKRSHSKNDWAGMLVFSDGGDRRQDDFIEAHVYGGFNAASIESADFAPDASLSRDERTDIAIIRELLGGRVGD